MNLSLVDEFLLKTRRGQTPFYRRLKKIASVILSSMLPVPRFMNPLMRALFALHQGLWRAFGFLRAYFYNGPLFRARCESAGAQLRVCRMPFVVGHARIRVGNQVNFFGQVDIMSGGIFAEPRLTMVDRVDI